MTGAEAGRFRKQRGQGEKEPIDADKIRRWATNLVDARYESRLEHWCVYRGVAVDVLTELQIGWHPQKRRYTIPVFEPGGSCVDVKLYRPHEKEFGKSLHYTEKRDGVALGWGKPPRLWGLDRVAAAQPGKGRAGVVLLCAGEPDAIVATGLGYLAVSPTSGEGSLCRAEDVAVLLGGVPGGWPIRVLFDTDTAGRASAGMWGEALLEFGFENVKNVELPFPNGDGKDLTDWIVNDEWGRTGPFEDAGSALWATIRASPKLDSGDVHSDSGNAGQHSNWKRGGGSGAGKGSGGDSGSPGGDDSGDSSDSAGGSDSDSDDGGDGRRPVTELIAIGEERIREGKGRNDTGLWFWCQIRDEGYSKVEALALTGQWVEVANKAATGKADQYSEAESQASLNSAYSSPKRDANGKGVVYPLTDLGNAERFIARHGDNVLYVPAMKNWCVWTGSGWRDGEDVVNQVSEWVNSVPRMMHEEGLRRARVAKSMNAGRDDDDPDPKAADAQKGAAKLISWARASESAGRLAAIKNIARDMKSVNQAIFDANEQALAVSNGTLILEPDGSVTDRGHQRQDFIRLKAPVEYRPGEEAGEWEKFLMDTIPDPEVVEYVQRLVGYSLLGGNEERKLIMIDGPTSSGKSTFGTVIQEILGGYAKPFNLSAFRSKQEESGRADLVNILPVRIIIANEASAAWHLHNDQIKEITGNTAISVRRLHSNHYIERKPSFTPWLFCNQIPTINGVDNAFYKRIINIQFGQSCVAGKEDPKLASRIVASEGAGVLNWILEGYRRYREGGLADVPYAVAQHAMSIREEFNEFGGWLSECTEGGAEYTEFSESLYESYANWCMANHISERDKLSVTGFGRSLTGLGFAKGPRKRTESNRSLRWTRLGIRLRKAESDVEEVSESG